ncbi:hypothetical protein GOP47_0004128 [Adiantum capillus-veneris]|uniref:hydroxyacylglutathione hydrolase n=1 Tax=Adiantum capillus-veneris TaxID=13818 RepID=A0A9D4V7M1_ADICA|nr:hypothetical protein GOP47_0004128 [Adiantum capillus-veneris]
MRNLSFFARLVDDLSGDAAVVDPVEPDRLVEAAESHGARIKFVITTHHHWDHAGGNDKIKKLIPGIIVYGGSEDNVQGQTDKLHDGSAVQLGDSIKITAMHTPCHTKGHVCYFVTDAKGGDPAVFTGDTLFIGGCGRFFEGTADQMYYSLCESLVALPPNTQVFCGHEYTVKNFAFALEVEPENLALKRKFAWAKQQRADGKPTVPSTISEELETNPFMRVKEKPVQDATGLSNPIEVMGALRRWKDGWKG